LFWILLLFFLPWPANVAALQAKRAKVQLQADTDALKTDIDNMRAA